MSYKQVLIFNLSKMGTKSGWCLQNCRLGFGIASGKYASAKAAMTADKKAGVFHMGLPSGNIQVPVYCDTNSQYEHVLVYSKGSYYSDGKKVAIKNYSVFGWSEYCDGRKVIEGTSDAVKATVTKTTTTDSFLPSKGYWGFGDTDVKVGYIATFMRNTFPAYTSKAALGNYFGKNLKSSIVTFQKKTGLTADGYVGPITLAKLREYGFTK